VTHHASSLLVSTRAVNVS